MTNKENINCSNCGEDSNFIYTCSRASSDWLKCVHCGEDVTIRNDIK